MGVGELSRWGITCTLTSCLSVCVGGGGGGGGEDRTFFNQREDSSLIRREQVNGE